jgi:hypothetical protein
LLYVYTIMNCLCKYSNGKRCSNDAVYPYYNPKVCYLGSHREKLQRKLQRRGGAETKTPGMFALPRFSGDYMGDDHWQKLMKAHERMPETLNFIAIDKTDKDKKRHLDDNKSDRWDDDMYYLPTTLDLTDKKKIIDIMETKVESKEGKEEKEEKDYQLDQSTIAGLIGDEKTIILELDKVKGNFDDVLDKLSPVFVATTLFQRTLDAEWDHGSGQAAKNLLNNSPSFNSWVSDPVYQKKLTKIAFLLERYIKIPTDTVKAVVEAEMKAASVFPTPDPGPSPASTQLVTMNDFKVSGTRKAKQAKINYDSKVSSDTADSIEWEKGFRKSGLSGSTARADYEVIAKEPQKDPLLIDEDAYYNSDFTAWETTTNATNAAADKVAENEHNRLKKLSKVVPTPVIKEFGEFPKHTI